MRSRCIALPFLISALKVGQLKRLSCFTPQEKPQVPIRQEAGWTLELVGLVCGKEKSLSPAGKKNHNALAYEK
jgi:hypothetical protein